MLRELTRMCTRFSETIRNWFLETGEVSAFGPPSLLISIFGGGQLPVYENRFKKQKKSKTHHRASYQAADRARTLV